MKVVLCGQATTFLRIARSTPRWFGTVVGWGTDKGELARRQANEDTLRRFQDETARQRQRLENLRAANDQLKEEIKALQSP
jgi:cell division protein FtsB